MSRGPERKDIDWDEMKSIVQEEGLVPTEKIRKEYNDRQDENLSWNTVKNRLDENDDFETQKAGNFEMWKTSD